jgi:hypothetical protein
MSWTKHVQIVDELNNDSRMSRIEMKTRTVAVAMVVASLWGLGPSAAGAQTAAGPWSVSFDAGAQVALSGDAHAGGTGRVLNLPTTVTAKSYDDVFGPGFYWSAGLGYATPGNGELRVQGSYTSNPSEQLQVGTVAGFSLLADFEDYRAFEMDFGYRQYLSSPGSLLRPFVGAGAGFVRVDRIRSTFSVPAANVVLSDVPFYGSSTVPGFGLGGGVQVGLSDAVALQVRADVKWHGDVTDDDGLAGTGLEGINDESRRWTMPVMGGITVRF